MTTDVAIRFDKLENLINENNKFLSEREKKATFSIGAELGNIREGRQKRWTVSGEGDIEKMF